MSTLEKWQSRIDALGLIAILRGLKPQQAVEIGNALADCGFGIVEVPLNSPQPLESIKLLSRSFGDKLIVGAGTVLTERQADEAVAAGAELIVAPNFDKQVAKRSVQAGAIYCPGVVTPTEAFDALSTGALALKLFPAEMITPAVVKALHAVLPADTLTIPVGGIDKDNIASYLQAGAGAFGIGSSLFKPDRSTSDIKVRAEDLVAAFNTARK